MLLDNVKSGYINNPPSSADTPEILLDDTSIILSSISK